MTSTVTTLSDIKKLEDRYPFSEEELEILDRCHEHLNEANHTDDFLLTLAKALPFSVFFLPNDEMRDRVNFLEDFILPMGFSSRLRCAISTDSFVDYANQGKDKSLERLVEGLAEASGRRGTKEALRVIYDILDEDATPDGLMELCVAMAIAAEVLVVPNLNRDLARKRLKDAEPCIRSMATALAVFCKDLGLNKKTFVEFAETQFVGLSSTLSTFVHNLLFHGHPYPKTRVPYSSPKLYQTSRILETDTSPLLLTLSFASNNFGGKWHRLYSSEEDGRSFDPLEWSLLGYTGPTVTLIETTHHAVLGAYTTFAWKESSSFFGDSGGFLFELRPEVRLYPSDAGQETNFGYLHTSTSKSTIISPDEGSSIPKGLGFGAGTANQPRLFVPESLTHCSASFFDKTYTSGDLLPQNEMDQFELGTLEVYGVGGEETIAQALRDQGEYRSRHEEALYKARVVHDKKQFVKDFATGLIPNTLFGHQRDVRGRQEYRVDDEHGGYKIERE